MLTIAPKSNERALRDALLYGLALGLAKAFGPSIGFIAIYAAAYGAGGAAGHAMIPMAMTMMIGACIIVAAAFLTSYGSRLATIGMPPALTILATAALGSSIGMLWTGYAMMGTPWQVKWLKNAAGSPATFAMAMAASAAIMRPMADWRKSPGAVAHVAVASYAAVEIAIVTCTWLSMSPLGSALFYAPTRIATRMTGLPEGLMLSALLIATAIWQRRSRAAPQRGFQRIEARRHLLIAVLASLVPAYMITSSRIVTNGPGAIYEALSGTLLIALKDGWLIWLPLVTILVARHAHVRTERAGTIAVGLSILPLILSIPGWLQYGFHFR